jgi:hypothetical protein
MAFTGEDSLDHRARQDQHSSASAPLPSTPPALFDTHGCCSRPRHQHQQHLDRLRREPSRARSLSIAPRRAGPPPQPLFVIASPPRPRTAPVACSSTAPVRRPRVLSTAFALAPSPVVRGLAIRDLPADAAKKPSSPARQLSGGCASSPRRHWD